MCRAAEDVIREQKKKKLLKKKQRAKVRKHDNNYYNKSKIRHNLIQLWFKLTQLEKNSSALDHSW